MEKIKIYELAKKFNVENKKLLEIAKNARLRRKKPFKFSYRGRSDEIRKII